VVISTILCAAANAGQNAGDAPKGVRTIPLHRNPIDVTFMQP
jgi:hypothetical protein